MKVTRIRTALAALAAIGAIAATGATAAASAAQTVQPGTTGTRLPVGEGSMLSLKTGQSTGDGPADDKECQAWADFINTVLSIALDDLEEGNTVGAYNMAVEADRGESDALGRGCLIVD